MRNAQATDSMSFSMNGVFTMPRLQYAVVFSWLCLSHYIVAQCGTERWNVKTLQDPAGLQIMSTAQPVRRPTIRAFGQLTRPTALQLHNGRVPPIETTIYEIDAVLVGWMMETNDSDYHLLLSDPAHANATM